MKTGSRMFDENMDSIQPGSVIYIISDSDSPAEFIIHDMMQNNDDVLYNDPASGKNMSERILDQSRFAPNPDSVSIETEKVLHQVEKPDDLYVVNNFHISEFSFDDSRSVVNCINTIRNEMIETDGFVVVHSQMTNGVDDLTQSVSSHRELLQTTMMNVADVIAHVNTDVDVESVNYRFFISKNRFGNPMTRRTSIDIDEDTIKPDTSRAVSN